MNDIKPSTENYNVVIPDFVTLTYDCIIWTEYVEQMNKIIESVNYAENAYWGDAEKFKFRAMVEEFSSETELEADADRLVRSAFTISMEGYIITDTMNKELANQNVRTFGPTQTVFNTRAVVERGGQLIEVSEFKDPSSLNGPAGPELPGSDDADGIISSNRFDPASYIANTPLTVTAGTVWTIDGTLTVNTTINNYGTIIMSVLDNNGTINNINSGTIIIE
jgi:hypothetical protein